ncbi:hypothetical protein P4641_18380 [Halalkalibacterium halodurans]|nr:hypothetical protein [Halalkalibacterium halodurans]
MEFLKQFPIFQEMTDDEFERLTRIAMKRGTVKSRELCSYFPSTNTSQ